MRSRLAVFFPLMLLAGCAANPKKQGTSAPVVKSPISAVKYDIPASARSEGGVLSIEAIRRDWTYLKELGFNAIVALQVQPADQVFLKRLASEKQMLLSSKDHELELYIRAGALPIECESASRLALRIGDRFEKAGSQHIMVCSPPRTPPAKERATLLKDAMRSIGVELVFGNAEFGVVDAISLSVIHADTTHTESEIGSWLERWLGDYHRGLANGKTGGFVFDASRFIPELSVNTNTVTESDSRARLAGLTELHNRSAAWGRLVIGCEAAPIASPPSETSHARLALLRNKSRRFLLAMNESDMSFIRQQVTLNGTMDGVQVQRLVEIPGTPGVPAGRIIDAHDGLIRIDVELRPGDAQLFEVFGK